LWDNEDYDFLLINTLIEATNLRKINLNSVYKPLKILAVATKKRIISGLSKLLHAVTFFVESEKISP